MFETFTDPARRLILVATDTAKKLNHPTVRTDHLVYASSLLEDKRFKLVFSRLQLSPDLLHAILFKEGKAREDTIGSPKLSPEVEALMRSLNTEAQETNRVTDPASILLRILQDDVSFVQQFIDISPATITDSDIRRSFRALLENSVNIGLPTGEQILFLESDPKYQKAVKLIADIELHLSKADVLMAKLRILGLDQLT